MRARQCGRLPSTSEPLLPSNERGGICRADRVWPVLVLALMGSGSLMTGCTARRPFPNRPVVLICPWSAGGGTDRVARQFAVLLEDELGVPVNVVNATGGGGVTGHTRGAVARADGYTLTLATVELNMLHWRGLTSIGPADFEPCVLLNRDDAALFVRRDSPWNDLSALLRDVRTHPGQFKASGTAQGGIWHVALAGWLDAAGLPVDRVIWISINGSAPSLQELLAGGVDLVCCSLPEAQALLEAGRIRCLGVMAEQRLPSHPDVPTCRELGVDWTMSSWRGVLVPRDVPGVRRERLVEAAERVARGGPFAEGMERAGFDHTVAGPEAFGRFMAAQDRGFGTMLAGDAFASVRRARFGPYFVPSLLLVLLGSVSLALWWQGAWRRPPGVEPLTWAAVGRLALVPAWVLVYLAAVPELGFVLTAGSLLAVLLWLLGVRAMTAGLMALVVAPVVYQLFAILLRVPLPWGLCGW